MSTIRTSHHEATIFSNMEDLLASLTRSVESAKRRIWIETYIYRSDQLGQVFGAKLIDAAARGVQVRLLYDALGSQATDSGLFEELREAGVDARPYRPMNVAIRSGKWWPRDHSRVIVVDDAGFTGGAAWGDEWLPRDLGGQGWHDVCSSVRGPVVSSFVDAFECRWGEAYRSAHPCVLESERYPDLEFVADSPAQRVLVFERHLQRIEQARHRIWIENAYFFPPRPMLEALFAARARGVEVKVILPCESDLKAIDRAARAEYLAWMDAGISLFHYMPSMTHAKFAVIDDDWATIGTFNANATSLLWANEANLFYYEKAVVAEIAALFERDLSRSRPVTRRALRQRTLFTAVRDVVWNLVLRAIEGENSWEGRRWISARSWSS